MWSGLTAPRMGVRILAAVRDLDPPAGGAEMSLATLLKGVVFEGPYIEDAPDYTCLLYTSPSPRDATLSRMPSSA